MTEKSQLSPVQKALKTLVRSVDPTAKLVLTPPHEGGGKWGRRARTEWLVASLADDKPDKRDKRGRT